MDYRKVDAALAAALDREDDDDVSLGVFLHVDPVACDRDALARMGVPAGSVQGGIATATLSPAQVRELSERAWVRQIRLSTTLRFLAEE